MQFYSCFHLLVYIDKFQKEIKEMPPLFTTNISKKSSFLKCLNYTFLIILSKIPHASMCFVLKLASIVNLVGQVYAEVLYS